MLSKRIKSLLPHLKNKYVISILAFVVWLFFFDQNNWINQIKYKLELNKLQNDKLYYLQEIEKTKKDLNEIRTNPTTLEKFAREKYLMKKENEEVFIILKEEND